jgi:hypothetical protein
MRREIRLGQLMVLEGVGKDGPVAIEFKQERGKLVMFICAAPGVRVGFSTGRATDAVNRRMPAWGPGAAGLGVGPGVGSWEPKGGDRG